MLDFGTTPKTLTRYATVGYTFQYIFELLKNIEYQNIAWLQPITLAGSILKVNKQTYTIKILYRNIYTSIFWTKTRRAGQYQYVLCFHLSYPACFDVNPHQAQHSRRLRGQTKWRHFWLSPNPHVPHISLPLSLSIAYKYFQWK